MKMMYSYFTTLFLFFFFSLSVQSKDQGTYTVTINGSISDPTCSVSSGSQILTVDMGTVASKSFFRAGDTTHAVPFTIDLEHCPSTLESVAIYFDGVADSSNNQLLSLNNETGAAKGIAIALLDSERTAIPVKTQTKYYSLPDGASTITLPFYAQYTATGATVVAGNASATSTFTLKYP